MKYTETFAQGVGYVTDDKGSKPMSGIRLAAQTREIVRSSPTLMLYAMEHPADVTSAGIQKLDGRSLPAIALKVGQYNYTVLFDRKTKLPAAIRSKDDDNIAGDSNFDLVLSDWKAVNGVQMAHTKSGRVNGVEVVRYVEKEVSANAPMLASLGTVPDEIKAKAAKGPPAAPTCRTSGCCAASTSRASSTATASSFRTAAASSSSSLRRTCSTSRAARRTT